jgi:uracil phosphoribosyltransferase
MILADILALCRIIIMQIEHNLTLLLPDHPFISHLLATCRDKATPMPQFRAAMAELGRWLTYETCRDWLPTREEAIETPLGVSVMMRRLDESQPIAIVPILRAALALAEGSAPLLPNARVYHVGYKRDEETAVAQCYMSGLPPRLSPTERFLLPEPMLATGGTLLQLMDELISRGANAQNIRVVCAIASQSALENIGARYPGLHVTCAAVDAELDERFYIVPGLGDAGDRAFGTE